MPIGGSVKIPRCIEHMSAVEPVDGSLGQISRVFPYSDSDGIVGKDSCDLADRYSELIGDGVMYSSLGVLTIGSADGVETWGVGVYGVDEPLIVGQGYVVDENSEVRDNS
jgi:hypothetical protein